MGLEIRIAGQRFGLSDLTPEGYTQDNLDPAYPTNDTLDPETTQEGVLAGSVAGLYGNLLVGKADADHRPVGLFVDDAQTVDLRGFSPLGSGKMTYVKGMGSYEIDVYETRNASDSTDLVYEAGNSLYTSARGFLTSEPGPGWQAEVIAVCTRAPTPADPVMWIDSRV